MRKCPCGEEISPTLKTVEFGHRHGRDLSKWPMKCNRCIIDWTLDMFTRLEAEGLPAVPSALSFDPPPSLAAAPPKNTCALCDKAIDIKVDDYFAGVPGVGDLCPWCHTQRFKEKS